MWEEVKAVCTSVVGRRDWSPEDEEGLECIFSDCPVTTQVLPHDKLVGVLHQHVLENYATRIDLSFGYEVTPIDFDAGDGVVVQLTKCRDDSDDEDAQEVRVNPISTTVEASNEQDTLCDPGCHDWFAPGSRWNFLNHCQFHGRGR